MKVQCLQHAPFEGSGQIRTFLEESGHSVAITHVYSGEPLPPIQSFELLVVMGGPMGVHDEETHPWLPGEKWLIKSAIDDGKIVLGICLGAQLIADVLGAEVTKGNKEIGWFPVNFERKTRQSAIAQVFPERLDVFHWHSDTFSIPEGATMIGSSEACANQGFVIEDRIVALQFHLEMTPESASTLIENCDDELDDSPFVQPAELMCSDESLFQNTHQVLRDLLEAMTHGHDQS